MARSDIQTQVILAVAAGAIIAIEESGIAKDEMPAILWAKEVSHQVFQDYPETGDPKKNLAATLAHCENLRDSIDAVADEYSPLILISISQILLTDLTERIKDKRKLDMLEPLVEAVDGIHNLLDPKGQHYDIYKEAERKAVEVKREIGFY